MGRSRERRQRKDRVGSKRQHNVAQPVLEYRRVGILPSHPPDYDHGVCDSSEAQKAPQKGDDVDRLPGRVQQGRQEQNDTEVNHRWAAKCGARLRRTGLWPVSNQSEDDELQSDQRARGRSDDYVESVPLGEF
jgi:hypothetical protein